MTRAGSGSPPDPTIQRLRRRSDFERVFRSGRRRTSGAVVVVIAPGEEGAVRLGLVAGRRVGGSVERNRAKRRLRHAARAAQIPTGLDVVVIASPGVLDAPFGDLVGWLTRACEQKESRGG